MDVVHLVYCIYPSLCFLLMFQTSASANYTLPPYIVHINHNYGKKKTTKQTQNKTAAFLTTKKAYTLTQNPASV